MTPIDELECYARLVLEGGVAIGAGDMLLVRGTLEHSELAAAFAREAYRCGARAVDAVYSDDRIREARLELAPEAPFGQPTPWDVAQWRALGREDVACIEVLGHLGVDASPRGSAERLAADSIPRFRAIERIRREGRLRRTYCAWPTEGWSAKVYPERPMAKAQRQLVKDLLFFCRIGPDDPPGGKAWGRHLAMLRARADALTRLDLKELRIRDDGTDLRLGIASASRWAGGGEKDI